MKDVGGDVWRELLMAAEKYSTQVAYRPTLPSQSRRRQMRALPANRLMRQRLRLEGFWKFIQDDVSSKRDAAALNAEAERKALAELPHGMPKEIEFLRIL